MSVTATPLDVIEGRARWCVVHGDNTEVLPTLPAKSVAHVIGDPPFDQDTSDNARTRKGAVSYGESAQFIEFAGITPAEVVPAMLRVAARWVVAFCALEQLGEYKVAAGRSWIRASGWWRDNPAPQFTGDRPGQRFEGIAIMHPPGRKRWNRGGECWSPRGPTTNGSNNGSDRASVGHPTPKPVWLMLDAVDAFTDPDEIILDPFCGSGTTGVACLRLGRRFIGIEKDAKYAAIARERIDAETNGLTLRDVRTGQLSLLGGVL